MGLLSPHITSRHGVLHTSYIGLLEGCALVDECQAQPVHPTCMYSDVDVREVVALVGSTLESTELCPNLSKMGLQ